MSKGKQPSMTGREPETKHKTNEQKSDSKEALYSFFSDQTKIPVTVKLKEFCRDDMLVKNDWSQKCSTKHLITRREHHDIYFMPSLDHKITLKIPVITKLPHKLLSLESSWAAIKHEAIMLNYARQISPNRVVNFKNVFDSEVEYSLCLEYIPSLEDLIMDKKREPLSWRTRLNIALEVATALKELHAHKILHGQIRSHHVLFDEKTKEVKLTDFSYAHFENDKKIDKLKIDTMGLSRRWITPEDFHEGNSANLATDIYGFGNLLYEMATGFQPFSDLKDPERMAAQIRAGQISEIPPECPLMIKELIQLCCSLDPNNRPTASELVEKLKLLISFLPKDPCTIDQETDALNYKFTSECRLAFFSGLHRRLGQDSPLYRTLLSDSIYDTHLPPTIFRYLS
jgi:serine/threonine protein kinase